jgi:hypothetical protein
LREQQGSPSLETKRWLPFGNPSFFKSRSCLPQTAQGLPKPTPVSLQEMFYQKVQKVSSFCSIHQITVQLVLATQAA